MASHRPASPPPLLERLPPANVDAEQAVIGSLLLDRDAFALASQVLDPDDFFRDSHRFIFEAMQALRSHGEPSDIVTVTDRLEKLGQLAACGGVGYIHSLATVVPTAIHIEHYATIVREAATHRRLISVAGRIGALGYDESLTASQVITDASSLVRDLLDRDKQQRGGHISTVSIPPEVRAHPMMTPFVQLNAALWGGFRPGISYVIAAPPGSMKTTMLVHMELGALLDDCGVCHITNELPAWVMRERYLSNRGGYSLGRGMQGNLYPDEQDWRETAELEIDQMPLFVWENVATVDEIGLRLASVKAQRPEVKQWLLVLDYIQRLGDDSSMDRQRYISTSFDRLQTLARKEQTPLLLASSLPLSAWNTDPSEWGGKDSGDIRGFASVFIGLKRLKDDDWQDAQHRWNLRLEAWMIKNTLGPECRISYDVLADCQRLTERPKV